MGFDSLTLSTIVAIALIVLSLGKRFSRTVITLDLLIDLAITRDLGYFSIGVDSLVSIDSLTLDDLSITVPSIGILVSGRTLKVSPY